MADLANAPPPGVASRMVVGWVQGLGFRLLGFKGLGFRV